MAPTEQSQQHRISSGQNIRSVHGGELSWDTAVHIPLRQALEFACELVQWYRCAVQDKQDRFLDEKNDYPCADSMCHEMEDCWMFQAHIDPQRNIIWMEQFGLDISEEHLLSDEQRIRNLVHIKSDNHRGSLALREAIWMWQQDNPLFVFHKNRPENQPRSDILIQFLKYIATTNTPEQFFRLDIGGENSAN